MKALALVLLVGCAVDPSQPPVSETSQAMTVIGTCELGHNPNATGDINAGDVEQDYVHDGAYASHALPKGCNCKEWKAVADTDPDATLDDSTVADSEAPTCRPYALVEFNAWKPAGDTRVLEFFAHGYYDNFVTTEAECKQSRLHMELWKQTSAHDFTRIWDYTGEIGRAHV